MVMEYSLFMGELKLAMKHIVSIAECKNKKELLYYELSGVKGVRFDREPISHNPELTEELRLELIDKIALLDEEIAMSRKTIKVIKNKIKQLSFDNQRVCLMIINGLSLGEIGREFSYSKSAIQYRLKKEVEEKL